MTIIFIILIVNNITIVVKNNVCDIFDCNGYIIE